MIYVKLAFSYSEEKGITTFMEVYVLYNTTMNLEITATYHLALGKIGLRITRLFLACVNISVLIPTKMRL